MSNCSTFLNIAYMVGVQRYAFRTIRYTIFATIQWINANNTYVHFYFATQRDFLFVFCKWYINQTLLYVIIN